MKTLMLAGMLAGALAISIVARPLAAQEGGGLEKAVVPLGELMVHEDREVALSARAALELIVHHAGRPAMELDELLKKIADKDADVRYRARMLATAVGASAEKRKVAAELAKLLSPGRPAKIKREAAHLIAFIGDDAVVPAIEGLLDDPDAVVREAARLSLERIPGKAASAALLGAARRLPADRKPDFIFSLSKKGDRSAAKDIAEFASSGDAEVRFAALEALARLGAPEGAPLIAAEIEKAPATDRGRLFVEYLRLADNLKPSNAPAAEAIYREVLGKSSLDFQREQALGSLVPEGKAEGLPLLLAALVDPSVRVRGLAAHRLEALKSPEVLESLKKAYDSAKAVERPAILRTIAERDPQAAAPFLEKASSDPNAEIKITALDILGRLRDPAMEETYLRSAESGPEWIKAAALKGYLVLAKGKLDSGAKAEALPMFVRALDLARDGSQRLEALRGIVAVGDPKEVERLHPYLQDSQLGGEASRGYVALAAAQGKAGELAGAEKRLMEIVLGEFPRDLKGKAMEELRALGIDPQRVARAQGFVLDWWVVTPIQNTDGKAMEKKLFPEERIELDAVEKVEARRYRWQRVKAFSLDGKIDLIPLFRRGENAVTYAYTEIESPSEREALFKMGSDDGIIAWLNGEKILSKPEPRGFKVDDDSVKVRLKAGVNKVLLKIGQKDGAWEFCFRITDQEEKPLELKAVVK